MTASWSRLSVIVCGLEGPHHDPLLNLAFERCPKAGMPLVLPTPFQTLRARLQFPQ